MFLLVPAYPGCPGSKAVKRSLLLLLLLDLLKFIVRLTYDSDLQHAKISLRDIVN